MDKKIDNEITEKDLVSVRVCFPKILVSSEKDYLSSNRISADGVNTLREMAFQVFLNWKVLGTRRDNKGVVIVCDFTMTGDPLKVEITIQVKMEFKKPIAEQQIFGTKFFQTLGAKIFFPYLAELIASNTLKLEFGTSPLILDDKLLDIILDTTEKQGVFQKPKIEQNN